MESVFEKLCLGAEQQIVVLDAPLSFQPELAALPVLTIHHHLESVAAAEFWLVFVTRKSEVERLAPLIAPRAKGGALVWFAYPTGASKKYPCDLNRNTGWAPLRKLGFQAAQCVALDEDWMALRFRRKEFMPRS
jgi:hypothetical protein